MDKNINRFARTTYADIIRCRMEWSFKKQHQALPHIDRPFIIIAVPGSIHLVELCMQFVPEDVNITLVANGIGEWEYNWLKEHLANSAIYRLSNILEHGRVIDILIRNLEQPFGILDYDCFVFQKSLFYEMQQLPSNTMLNAVFCFQNADLNLALPETFFLFFNAAIMKAIQRKYHIGSRSIEYDEIPNSAMKKLATMAINKNSLPEPYKKYFDTLRLINCLGLAEGYNINFVKKLPLSVTVPSDAIYHVGGSTHKSNYSSKWAARGAYFWRIALEACVHEDLISYYKQKYGNFSPRDILLNNTTISNQLTQDFFMQAEKIVNYQSQQRKP